MRTKINKKRPPKRNEKSPRWAFYLVGNIQFHTTVDDIFLCEIIFVNKLKGRHTRAIHWYRSGIPLPLISDYLGHENLQTTLIYAYADTEMKRTALEKANALGTQIESAPPKWKTDEDMIKRLYALK